MKDSDFSTAIKKIKEDCKLFGMSKNHLAEPLRKNRCKVTVNDDSDNTKIIKQYFVTPEEATERSKQVQ